MSESSSAREIIKCVLVGDRGVGKTRLICAHVCRQKMTLDQLMTVHTPTVWAVDPYRIYTDVIDGFRVSYRPWDTFGDHKNDRCFAYSNAHVVLVCFSAVNKKSLEHAKIVWYQEIRKYCPHAAIILVACKTDLRYIWQYPEFESLLLRRPRTIKAIQQHDIVRPSEGRTVAEEIGGNYMETSVLNSVGVDEVFQNAIRVAFAERRRSKFRFGTLITLNYPKLQKPYLPEKPTLFIPAFSHPVSTFDKDISVLYQSDCGNYLSDVEVTCGRATFYAHQLILAAGSKTFFKIFRDHSCTSELFLNFDLSEGKYRLLGNHEQMSEELLKAAVEFLYTGSVHLEQLDETTLNNISKFATTLEIPELINLIDNVINGQDYVNNVIKMRYLTKRNKRLFKYGFQLALFTVFVDVLITFDDTQSIGAHKFLLSARCDFMKALFGDNFRETNTSEVHLPGITKESFVMFYAYIFTDTLFFDSCKISDYLSALEMANRFCLPSFQLVVEREMVNQLQKIDHPYFEDVVQLLEFAQLHNSNNVSKWCLHYLSCNYNLLNVSIFEKMSSSNQSYIKQHCWPPSWYFEECQLYDSMVTERQEKSKKVRKKLTTKKSYFKDSISRYFYKMSTT